jgi:oxygen-dependent protoporphyrinogen oxidase
MQNSNDLDIFDFDAPAGGGRPVDVLICGGGISGLSLATWLRRAGVEAVVLDRNATPGGVIGTLHQDGFIFERGPNTILDKYDSFNELVQLAGLEDEIIRVPLATQQRHVWLGGRLNQVPTNPLAFLRTPLLPREDKLNLFREPFVPPVRDDETVADFVRRRLGKAWLRNLVTPMVSGIWAGDPERMSTEHSFPVMKEMERDGGSLIRGAFRRIRRIAAERKAAGLPRRKKNLVSFLGGLQRLPIALAEKLGENYHSGVSITSLHPLEGGGFSVAALHGDHEETWTARELVIAAEADQAAKWVEPFDAETAIALRSVPYNRLAVVGLGLGAADAALPPGFGFLAPRGEGLRILGAIINSNFLPGRAPAGAAALTIFIGGELDPAAADLSEEELIEHVRHDLGLALQWRGAVRSAYVEHWPRAIPQYDMLHANRLRWIAAAEARWPGLNLVGNWRGGVAVGDRVETTLKLADAIQARLASSPEVKEDWL